MIVTGKRFGETKTTGGVEPINHELRRVPSTRIAPSPAETRQMVGALVVMHERSHPGEEGLQASAASLS